MQVAHNAFRRYETTSVLFHVSLLTIPPVCTILYTAPQSLTASLAVFPTYLVSLAAFTILYRLSPLHPLARYPGPLSCKATKLRYAILSLSGRQHEFIHELHERYGDVVRIGTLAFGIAPACGGPTLTRGLKGPNELSIRDASAITTLLGASGVPKGPRKCFTKRTSVGRNANVLTPTRRSVGSNARPQSAHDDRAAGYRPAFAAPAPMGTRVHLRCS